MLCDEAVRKVRFIGWFVDGWGKIDPRQMGEDNRQTGERKRLIARISSKNEIFSPKSKGFRGFWLQHLFISVYIRDDLNGFILRSNEQSRANGTQRRGVNLNTL